MDAIPRGCNVTLLSILTAICLLPCLAAYLAEPDVWFHMSCGKEMLATGTVDVSKFYYTVVNTNINDFQFTWLGDIALYLTYFLGGPVALQILRAEFIVLTLWLMWMVSDKKLNAYKCLIAVLVTYGAAHLLIVRNSIFSIIGVSTLWYLHLNDVKYKHLWSIAVLVFWSQTHGSFLLGLCMYGLLAVTSIPSFILVVGFVLLANWATPLDIFSYLQLPTSFNLNELLFKTSTIRSMDFCSPFQIEQHYTAMILFLSIMHVALIKRIRWVYVVVFLATLIPALGYIRMGGYHAITCGMCLLYAERRGDLRKFARPSVVVVLVMLAGFQGWRFNSANMGVGVSPVFGSLTNQQVTRNVFTQDYLASYLYFTYGVKGFFSTFHAPHPKYVHDAYDKYIKNPDLVDKSINTCIIKDRIYASKFLNSPEWRGSKQGHVYIFNRRGVM